MRSSISAIEINRTKSLTLYFASEILLSIGIGMVLYAQPFFYSSKGLSDAVIGMLFAVNSLFGGIAALILGSVADYLGASRVFKVASLMIPTGYLIMVLVHGVGWWMASAAFSGIAGAMLLSTENVVLSSLTKARQKAGILSRFVAMYTFVMGFGTIAAGWLSAAIGFQTTIEIGAFIALSASALRVFVRAPDAVAQRAFRRPSKQILWMSGYAILFGLALNLLTPFATLIMKDSFGLGDKVISSASAAATFMAAFGSLLVGFALRYLKTMPTLVLSFLSAAGVTAVMAFGTNAGGFVGLYLLRTVMTSVPVSIVDATFLELSAKDEYAQMFGVRVFGNRVGNAIGSSVGGKLLSHGGVRIDLFVSAIALAATLSYLSWLLKRVRVRRQPQMSQLDDLSRTPQ